MQMDSDDDGNMWPEIVPPSISAPLNGLTGLLVTLGLGIVLRPFTSGYDTHVSTDFIITDAATGSVVWQSLANTVNLLGITIPALTLTVGKTYIIRVRYRGVKYVSLWSDPITIST